MGREAEGIGLLQPGEERASGATNSNTPVVVLTRFTERMVPDTEWCMASE